MRNKKLIVLMLVLLSAAVLYWCWTRPETPGYQGGMPAQVNTEAIESSSVSINGQETLEAQATVKSGAIVEVVVHPTMTAEYTDWKSTQYDFDFRPKVDGRVDWDFMRDILTGYITPDKKSQWTVQLEPGEYEFRLHILASNESDVTQPPQMWMIAQGQLLVQPE